MTTVGIVGCGSIGKAILRAADAGRLRTPIGGVASRTEETAQAFMATLDRPPPLLGLTALVEACDLIVEAAGGHVVNSLARSSFSKGKSLMVISVGALLDHPELFDLARETRCDLIVPSGAIAGLDGIKEQHDPGPSADTPYEAEAPLLPKNLGEALTALRASALFRRHLGDAFVDYFIHLKEAELARFTAESAGQTDVTVWEQNEYFDLF